MPTSTDINLPKSEKPKFPDKCVSCGMEKPGSTYRAFTHAIGWWTWVFWSFGPRFTAEVPACDTCKSQMRRQWWLRFFMNLIFIIAGVLIAGSLLQWYKGPFKKWLMMGIAIIFMAPLFLWETFFPKAFDMTATSDSVDYEFRDVEYAAEFLLLNRPELFGDKTEPEV